MSTGAARPAGPPGPAGGPARRVAPARLRLYWNPLRLAVSGSTWRAAGFLAGYIFVAGWLLFAVAFTATVTAAVFLITLAGIPLLVAAAGVLRGCASCRARPAAAGAGRARPRRLPPGDPAGRHGPGQDPLAGPGHLA